MILKDWGRLEEAFELLKKEESLCLELGDKKNLQINCANQAMTLHAWGRPEDEMTMYKKLEALFLELDDKQNLQITGATKL